MNETIKEKLIDIYLEVHTIKSESSYNLLRISHIENSNKVAIGSAHKCYEMALHKDQKLLEYGRKKFSDLEKTIIMTNIYT